MLAAALGALAISALSMAPASADTPGWQSVGNSEFYLDADGSGCHTKPLESGGGHIKVTHFRPGRPTDWASISVWEYDPDNPDDHIITLPDMQDGMHYEPWVGGWEDGDNGKAEIYFRGPCTGAPWVHMDD
ncbi:hypothetical protein ABZ471_40090 [Streptomyces sp. NPDC005728]|uniref:hypothetical protein n=1 Tax=Streptomyces sp. NPDC005728 TaxID=3157054 RepID=UPI00340B3A61